MRTVLTILLVLLVPQALAQSASESIEVTIIEVPVTVHDGTGKPVRGLVAENFELSVDGNRVPAEYFDVVDLANIEARKDAVPAAAYRNFLLLFDLANSAPGTIGRAQSAARSFIDSGLSDRDLAAVATFTNEQGARMVTSFTRDKTLLRAAVNTLGEAKFFKTMDPLLLSANFTDQVGAETPETNFGVKAEALAEHRADMKQLNEISKVAEDSNLRTRVRTQLANFGGVARALDRLYGQKQIILLSEGFDVSLLTGRQDLSFQSTQAENDAVASGEIWRVDAEQRFGSGAEAHDIREMIDIFRRSDVRLHAVDIGGIRTNVDARDGLQKKSNESLFVLTRPTGGTVFRNDNDLSAQMTKLLAQQQVIYILGFRSRDPKPGKFHPVRVRLAGAKGEVTHRSGYYDRSSNLTELEATLRFSQMLMTRDEVRDIPLGLVALPVPGDEESARVPVLVDIPGAQLLEGVDAAAVHANVFVYAFDAKGEAVDFLQQRLSLDLLRTGNALRAAGVRYVGGLRLPPGDYRLKALVRVDETGRMGLTTSPLVVPAYAAAVVLPPVAMGEMGSWLTVVSPARGAEAKDVLTLGGRPFIPGVRPEIVNGAEQEFALMLRGIATESLSITPALVGRDGASQSLVLQLAGRTEPDEYGLSKLLFHFPAQTFAAGEYDLRVTVLPKGGVRQVVSLPVTIR